MVSKEQDADSTRLKDPETGAEFEIIDRTLLMEWLAEHYKQYGAVQWEEGPRPPRCALPNRRACVPDWPARDQARVHHQQVAGGRTVCQGLWRHRRCVLVVAGSAAFHARASGLCGFAAHIRALG
jgi:hypothetical protein